MDEYLSFENAIFCSSSCNSFIFNNVLTTVNTTDIRNYNSTKKTIGYQIQCSVFGISLFPLNSTF